MRICKHEGCGNPARQTMRNGKPRGDKECSTCTMLRGKYGIHNGERKEMLANQGNKCLICGNITTLRGDSEKYCRSHAVIDHDHTKKKGDPGFIRGILCDQCNIELGYYENTQDKHEKFKEYLCLNQQ